VIAEPPRLRDEDTVIALRRILSASHNDWLRHLSPSVVCEAGDRLAKSDPIVKHNQADFMLVVPAGLTAPTRCERRPTSKTSAERQAWVTWQKVSAFPRERGSRRPICPYRSIQTNSRRFRHDRLQARRERPRVC
jgi:hypothetical protein